MRRSLGIKKKKKTTIVIFSDQPNHIPDEEWPNFGGFNGGILDVQMIRAQTSRK